MPGEVEVEGLVGPMPVALFMLLGPLLAEGEPAEFCMPVPLLAPMLDALPVDVACDGFAFMAEEPGLMVEPELELPALAAPGPELDAPVPMVWADEAVATSAKAAPAIKIDFIGYPPDRLIRRLTRDLAWKLR